MEKDEELTIEEQKSIDDFDKLENKIKGGITEVKSKTGNIRENMCYGK